MPGSCFLTLEEKRPVRPYRQASPSPARHRPGARFARRERCDFMASQTTLEKESPHVVPELLQAPEFNSSTVATSLPTSAGFALVPRTARRPHDTIELHC